MCRICTICGEALQECLSAVHSDWIQQEGSRWSVPKLAVKLVVPVQSCSTNQERERRILSPQYFNSSRRLQLVKPPVIPRTPYLQIENLRNEKMTCTMLFYITIINHRDS